MNQKDLEGLAFGDVVYNPTLYSITLFYFPQLKLPGPSVSTDHYVNKCKEMGNGHCLELWYPYCVFYVF